MGLKYYSIIKIYSCLFLLITSISGCQRQSSFPPEITVDAVPLLNLNSLLPKIEISVSAFSSNFFSVDNQGNFYFLDLRNNRIVMFNQRGEFLRQIGSSETDKEISLPLGFFVDDFFIYVLNKKGGELKIFSLQGDLLSSFSISNAWFSDGIYVEKEKIFIAVKDKSIEADNKKRLITIFDFNGNYVNSVGKIIKTKSPSAYAVHNYAYFQVIDGIIYGAFRSRPIIFAYKISGQELFFKNIADLNLPELLGKKEKDWLTRGSELDSRRPIEFVTYCDGFAVDKQKNIFYAINNYDTQSNKLLGSRLLVFNGQGGLSEKIILKIEGRQPEVKGLFINGQNKRYGLGIIEKEIILFDF